MKILRRRALFLLALAFPFLSGASAQRPQNQPQFSLDGTWINDQGEEIDIDHLPSGTVIALFTGKSAGGKCPNGGNRPKYFEGQLVGNTLAGTMWRCTRDPHLVNECGVDSVFTVKFTAAVTQDKITGKRHSEWFDPQRPDSRGCRYVRNSSKDSEADFSVTRACSPDKRRRCGELADASRAVSNVIDQPPYFPTANFSAWKQNFSGQLRRVRDDLCDDPAAQSKLDQLVNDLASLNYAGGPPTLEQRRVLARIDLGLKDISKGACGGATTPPAAQTCRELSNYVLDGMQTFFDKLDELQKGPGPADNDAYDQVMDGIRDAIKELEDYERSAEGAGPGSTLGQQLDDIREKKEKLKELLGYWQQIKKASCLPPEIPQLLRRLAEENRARAEHQATCTELCAKTADWIVSITGDPRQRSPFFKACFASCR